MSVWFVTGASRGFGADITDKALEAGHHVVATARHPQSILDRFPSQGDRLIALPVDVTIEAQIATAVDIGESRFGPLDVVVNNAGRGLLSAVEEASDAAARAVYDTNVFGTLNVIRAVLPSMRARRSGRIINLSSIGGFVGSPGWGIYNSTKFAVEGFSEALRKELEPLGIAVVLVEPGYFRTDFLDSSSLHTELTVIDDYAGTAGATRKTAATVNHLQPGDPAKAAAVILEMATTDHPPARIQLGADAFTAVAAKLARVADEQSRWRTASLGTDHDDVATLHH